MHQKLCRFVHWPKSMLPVKDFWILGVDYGFLIFEFAGICCCYQSWLEKGGLWCYSRYSPNSSWGVCHNEDSYTEDSSCASIWGLLKSWTVALILCWNLFSIIVTKFLNLINGKYIYIYIYNWWFLNCFMNDWSIFFWWQSVVLEKLDCSIFSEEGMYLCVNNIKWHEDCS